MRSRGSTWWTCCLKTPFGNVGVGTLYVGDSTSAVQWAGFHVAYIINCADINYAWHPWCPRFWLNVGFRGLQEELNWSERMMVAVKLVMLALMFGQGVLLHCRQGKHPSGAFCVLMLALLWGCSVQEALDRYWSRRPDLRPHDWSILDKILFRKNNFNALVESVRRQSWFPKARGNILNRLWAFRVQPPIPKPKKRPRLTSAPGERGTSRQTSPPRDQCSASSSEAPGRLRQASLSRDRRSASSSGAPADISSSSGSSEWLRVQVCHLCGLMPWSCRCNPERRAELVAAFFSQRSASTADPVPEPHQVSAELFRRMSQRAGVWDDAQAAEHHATKLRDRSRSPSPEAHDKEAWECPECHSLNSLHVLHCAVATCGNRRPLMQNWRSGDYFCEHCGNHRFASSLWCNWVHCHSNDWTCPMCQNKNFAARKTCNTRRCQHPRDWTCPRCSLVNWIVRPACKDCGKVQP